MRVTLVLCGQILRDPERERASDKIRLKMGTATNRDLHKSEVGKHCWQHGSFSRTLRAADRQTDRAKRSCDESRKS